MTEVVSKQRKVSRKTQARSLERRSTILTVARELLEENAINELSLYQVAEKAGMPPSSVYHFFPKVDAILEALLEDIFTDFEAILDQPLDESAIHHWTDIMRQLQVRYVSYYRQHKYVRDLILGQYTPGALLHADYQHDDMLGCRIRKCHEAYYQLPPLPAGFNIFAIALQIADKVYSISHQEYGNITDVMAREGVNAALAYLGEYIPRQLISRQSALSALGG
ncbi:TetR/AcrR family transcriptional regulator [Salinisphaera sp. G21_0]|uniref:TetR/AcrR family transcriptional regulator n=1 Tax=Salinisphaera sp. G21_0 TaxID=2821094 RepID=UPI001ADA369C|nr:TetR/AcrR family transcriptional regulator [Salinisphaera sp. G21_0]MBO9482883.1 TetR/AcrR family transcriptional regulator [Salinisphaera sp. G21_0]